MQGIESLGPNVAKKLAAMGQFEDDQIAHVAEGEVIVPAPIMKYFPEVREQVFSAIRETGLEPEQFIVGGDMVAVNPNTGIQEFGFLKKAFKKIKKFVKKAGPLLLAAALPGVGSFLAAKGGMLGALGKGIGALTAGKAGLLGTSAALDTALKGGNLKDVAKAGATGAAIGGITQGISNQITGQSGGYFTEATPAPTAAATTSTASSSVAPPEPRPMPPSAQAANAAMPPDAQTGLDMIRERAGINTTGSVPGVDPGFGPAQLTPGPEVSTAIPFGGKTGQLLDGGIPGVGVEVSSLPPLPASPPVDYSSLSLSGGADSIIEQIMQGMPTGGISDLGATTARKQAEKSLLERAGSFALDKVRNASLGELASTGLLGAGLLMPEDDSKQDDGLVSQEELAQMFGVSGYDAGGSDQFTPGGLFYNPETESFQDVPYVQSSGIMTVAGGGHIMGPGTGTSDSIPAYLSDGEFVMTADAVKGAGGGDRKKGAAKMYAMMNKFEGRA
ncbi:MAG: hypothetical protein Tp1109DCM542121_57 [Prokaryotic dsDNA virus sp.]|nr:MAG: hypothetical protein Tp1109DCM542121_57 [Prokaryotic dsDNA virus sp.]|tara:strand:+ start:34154 stop:35659 length:1506 start_codon:yes stop_codon:yes gene_type:complete